MSSPRALSERGVVMTLETPRATLGQESGEIFPVL